MGTVFLDCNTLWLCIRWNKTITNVCFSGFTQWNGFTNTNWSWKSIHIYSWPQQPMVEEGKRRNRSFSIFAFVCLFYDNQKVSWKLLSINRKCQGWLYNVVVLYSTVIKNTFSTSSLLYCRVICFRRRPLLLTFGISKGLLTKESNSVFLQICLVNFLYNNST